MKHFTIYAVIFFLILITLLNLDMPSPTGAVTHTELPTDCSYYIMNGQPACTCLSTHDVYINGKPCAVQYVSNLYIATNG